MFFEYQTKEKNSLDDFEWLRGDEIYVAPNHWKEIKANFDISEIQEYLKDLIKKYQIPCPMSKVNYELERQRFNKLKTTHFNLAKKEWTSYRLDEDFNKKYLNDFALTEQNHQTGKSISNAFMEKVRYSAGYKHSEYRTYVDDWQEILEGKYTNNRLLRSSIHFANDVFDTRAILAGTRLSTLAVTQFKPSVAKAIYDFFDAENVLDFCAGWGDRLVGFNASNSQSYIGIDPNSKLHEPYRKIHQFCNTGKKATFICSPAEEVDYSDLKYDFVFTSPPYFDLEIYSQEETQSVKKFNTFDLWLEGFLLTTLSKIYEGLDEGGRIAVNIADNENKKVLVCTDMVAYMESIGATFEGIIGYGLQTRPKSIDTEIRKAEPIFIWSKGKAKDPKWNQDNYFGV